MKLLKQLKNRLRKIRLGQPQNNQEVKNTKTLALINKAIRDEDDMFMFI